jgi:DNA-binding cell septation regulator SpoVG
MRPKYQEIKKDCEKIKALWAKGWDDAQIRLKLKMTSTVYENRLKYIAKDRFDTNKEFTLLQYQIKKQRRYDQLEAILSITKDDNLKLKCIQEMNTLDDGFVRMGQRLGVFHEEPKKVAGVVGVVDIPSDINTDDVRKEFQTIVVKKTKKLIHDKYSGKKKVKRRKHGWEPKEKQGVSLQNVNANMEVEQDA